MAIFTNPIAWFAIMLGLYSLGAAIGELRLPGSWAKMMQELSQSKGLQFIIGFVLISLGFAVLASMPYDPADWLSILVVIFGLGALLEGVMWLAMPDIFARFGVALMRGGGRIWAIIAAIFGIVIIIAGAMRL